MGLIRIAERKCGATDGLGLDEDDPSEPFGQWRGPAPGERCGICGKDGSEH